MKLQYLHQIASTLTLICRPIPPNCPTLSSPLPQTVTINWLLPLMGGTATAFCCCWPPRLLSHRCRTIPVIKLHLRHCPQHPCCHPPPCHRHCIFIVLRLLLRVASHLLPCPSSASSPSADCCIASPHATASHLPGASASHRTVTSCHAPLAPLVQLIVALPLPLSLSSSLLPLPSLAVAESLCRHRQCLHCCRHHLLSLFSQLLSLLGTSSAVLSSSPSQQMPWAFPSSSPSPVAQRHH